MWRFALVVTMVLAGMVSAPAAAQDAPDAPADLAAMLVPPSALPEPGYQLARGGYLTPDDVRYLIEQRYQLDDASIASLFEAVPWRQGYTGTYHLLSDRSYRSSAPLASVSTRIHELESGDGAMAVESLMTGAPPDGAEERDAAVEGATTWRVVTSQADTLVTVVRSGRFVLEVTSADYRRAPDALDHTAIVGATLRRVEEGAGPGLSRLVVKIADSRLIPIAVPTEAPLVHDWYRLLDGEVIPAAGEMDEPEADAIAPDLEGIVISRQTAELASQNWVTAGVVLARFDSPAAAADFDGVIRDPLDFFPETEDASAIEIGTPGVAVARISGETTAGGRYSGYRVTVVEEALVSQITVRAMGNTLLSQEAVEGWAELQRACVAGGGCGTVPLETLLRTPDPATPVAGDLAEGVYVSPVAPWSVRFDPAVWQVDDRFAEGGYDYLYLRSERMDATLETIVDHHGDPEQCVLGELDRLREDEDRARIAVGDAGEVGRPGGLEPGHGWIVYTVEPLDEARADQEYVIRIDCYTVVEGSTSLVVQVRAPRDAWADAAPLGEALRSQIEIDGAPSGRETGDLLAMTPHARSDEMITRRPWVGAAA
jgi:hypothetical protein